MKPTSRYRVSIKLEEEQIWQKVGTLDVRAIDFVGKVGQVSFSKVRYSDIGGTHKTIEQSSFRRWLRQNNAKLVGHYDFRKKKARAV